MSEYLFTGWTKKQMAAEYLRRGMLPIPLDAGSKKPARNHKPVVRSDGTFGPPAWDRQKAMAFADWNRADYYLGILCGPNPLTGKIPFVIDCDMPELFAAMEAKFPDEVASAGLQKTRNGFHVVFARSEYADQRGVFDNFKMYLGSERKHAGDIKTVTKTVRVVTTDSAATGFKYATPGNLVAFPSANKFWVRLPDEVPDVPDKVVDWVFSLSGVTARKKGAKRSKVVKEDSPSGDEDEPEVAVLNLGVWTPTPRHDLACLRALGFSDVLDSSCKPYVRTYSGEEHKSEWALGCYQFHSEVAPCPMCAKPEGHQKNHYFVLYSADGDRYVLNFSSSCVRGGRRIEWTSEGRSAWRSALADTPQHALVPDDGYAQAAVTLPLETYIYVRALRELNPSWSFGNVFKPKDDGRFAGFMQVRGAGGVKLVGITHDGSVEIGEKAADNEPYTWSPLTASAGRILDKDLTAWFAKAFPEIERDDGGVFLLPVCHAPCLRVGDERQDDKTRRQHAHCVMRTRRPWTRLRELEAHRSIKEDPA